MKSSKSGFVLVTFTAVLFSGPCTLSAATVEESFDHVKDGNVSQKLEVSPGDTIKITINQTCPNLFEYVQTPFPEAEPDKNVLEKASLGCSNNPEADLAAKGFCVLKTASLEFTHSTDASTYLIEVLRKEAATEPKGITQDMFGSFLENGCAVPQSWEGNPQALPNRRYILRVDATWALGMSGGFTVSSVTDPRYAIVNNPASDTDPPGMIVVRNGDAEDSHALGFAGFVHLHNRNLRWRDVSIAPTFGLGVGDQNTLSGFVGIGFGAKDIGYINVGWNWRQVDRLPTGQRVDEAPISDNVLSDLPNRVDEGWFIGFSFRFMSPGESFFTGRTVKPDVGLGQ